MRRSRPEPAPAGYQNAPMDRKDAVDIAAAVGLVLAEKGPDGVAIPNTSRVEIATRGAGFDLIVPAELLGKLALVSAGVWSVR